MDGGAELQDYDDEFTSGLVNVLGLDEDALALAADMGQAEGWQRYQSLIPALREPLPAPLPTSYVAQLQKQQQQQQPPPQQQQPPPQQQQQPPPQQQQMNGAAPINNDMLLALLNPTALSPATHKDVVASLPARANTAPLVPLVVQLRAPSTATTPPAPASVPAPVPAPYNPLMARQMAALATAPAAQPAAPVSIVDSLVNPHGWESHADMLNPGGSAASHLHHAAVGGLVLPSFQPAALSAIGTGRPMLLVVSPAHTVVPAPSPAATAAYTPTSYVALRPVVTPASSVPADVLSAPSALSVERAPELAPAVATEPTFAVTPPAPSVAVPVQIASSPVSWPLIAQQPGTVVRPPLATVVAVQGQSIVVPAAVAPRPRPVRPLRPALPAASEPVVINAAPAAVPAPVPVPVPATPSKPVSQPPTPVPSTVAAPPPAAPAAATSVQVPLKDKVDLSKSVLARAPMTKALLRQTVNPKSFATSPEYARFFVIKSFSEEDIHKSLKYSIWASTTPGNNRLDKAFRESSHRGPIYLFFSVNGSGHFQGMAQMMTPVDYESTCTVWAQDLWKGVLEVKWIFVKDVPNSALRDVTLSNNENKPVTNSRDTQEVLLEPGKRVLSIIAKYEARMSILDDFDEYDKRKPVPEGSAVVVPTAPSQRNP